MSRAVSWLRRAGRRLEHAGRCRWHRRRDLGGAAGGAPPPPLRAEPLLRVTPDLLAGLDLRVCRWCAEQYLAHRFDWLGLGWLAWDYETLPPGCAGHRYDTACPPPRPAARLPAAHVAAAEELLALLPADYRPLDWHRDLRSGYRWPATAWGLDLARPAPPGADLKMPWELGRLAHLPRLALAAHALPELRPRIVREFRATVLDFLAWNPPRVGVQWATSMDVGLRTMNVLVAWDLLRPLDAEGILAGDFAARFARLVADHARHLVAWWEGSAEFTNNHYLGCLAGLAAAAAWTTPGPESDGWLALAAQDCCCELAKQFHPDGSTFEAASAYHAFSLEMLAWSLAAVRSQLPARLAAVQAPPPAGVVRRWAPNNRRRDAVCRQWDNGLPAPAVERLRRAAAFCRALTRPDGLLALIGDNDSGRLLSLAPRGRWLDHPAAVYLHLAHRPPPAGPVWDEEVRDYAAVPSLVEALLGGPATTLEARLLATLAGAPPGAAGPEPAPRPLVLASAPAGPWPHRHRLTFAGPAGVDLVHGLVRHDYPDGGWYLFQGPHLWWLIRAGDVGQGGVGGHGHNDALSFELMLGGELLAVDPGTYLYTPSAAWRDALRSVTAHHGLVPEPPTEPNPFRGPFRLEQRTRCQVVEATATHLAIRLDWGEHRAVRSFRVTATELVIEDTATFPFQVHVNRGELLAPGYGRLVSRPPALAALPL